MPAYEVTFVVKPELTKAAKRSLIKELRAKITQAKGAVIKEEEWGKKTLAYEIAGLSEGEFWHLKFNGPGLLPKTIADFFSLKDEVIRELVLRSDGKDRHPPVTKTEKKQQLKRKRKESKS